MFISRMGKIKQQKLLNIKKSDNPDRVQIPLDYEFDANVVNVEDMEIYQKENELQVEDIKGLEQVNPDLYKEHCDSPENLWTSVNKISKQLKTPRS